MTSRILPREDWGLLAGTDLEALLPVLPADTAIVVVEDGDHVIGTWAVYRQYHIHGCWVAPSHRAKGGVFRRLLAGMRETARRMGAVTVVTGSLDPGVSSMLARLGAVELPGTQFALRVKD